MSTSCAIGEQSDGSSDDFSAFGLRSDCVGEPVQSASYQSNDISADIHAFNPAPPERTKNGPLNPPFLGQKRGGCIEASFVHLIIVSLI